MRRLIILSAGALSACASSQGGMMEQEALRTLTSNKPAAEVAGCVQQALRGGPTMGTDGKRYWVTRQNAWGTAVRFDFIPAQNGSGSIVEYRSRIRVNNGIDKVEACL